MLNPGRALSLNADSGHPLPRVEAFEQLYAGGCTPRHGEVIMVAGRSGTQKSGFALFWVDEMNLPTLYFSADMSPFTASARVASKRTGLTTDQVESAMSNSANARRDVLEALDDSNITFTFGSPITFQQIDEELDAYVELNNEYPQVLVFDNLMDFDGAEADYTMQMEVIQRVTELARDTGATVILMHHASDKVWDAKAHPWSPPSRDQIKNGLAEKPELSLTVALNPETLEYQIAVVKQRMGPSDPTATQVARLRCEPELTRFHKRGITAPLS